MTRNLSAILRDAADFLALTSGATGPVIGDLVFDLRARARVLDSLEHNFRKHSEQWTPDARAIAAEILRAIGQGSL
jgi:hypothetical protein